MSGTYLQYNSTVLPDSPSNVILTIGGNESVECVQLTGPVPTSIRWYDPQGELVSSDPRNKVNQTNTAGGGRVAYLHFQNYTQSQGGMYECRVAVRGNNLTILLACIG